MAVWRISRRDWLGLVALAVLLVVVDAVCVFASVLNVYLFTAQDDAAALRPTRPPWVYWAVDVLSFLVPPVVTLGPLALVTRRWRRLVLAGGGALYVLMQLGVLVLTWRH